MSIDAAICAHKIPILKPALRSSIRKHSPCYKSSRDRNPRDVVDCPHEGHAEATATNTNTNKQTHTHTHIPPLTHSLTQSLTLSLKILNPRHLANFQINEVEGNNLLDVAFPAYECTVIPVPFREGRGRRIGPRGTRNTLFLYIIPSVLKLALEVALVRSLPCCNLCGCL